MASLAMRCVEALLEVSAQQAVQLEVSERQAVWQSVRHSVL